MRNIESEVPTRTMVSTASSQLAVDYANLEMFLQW